MIGKKHKHNIKAKNTVLTPENGVFPYPKITLQTRHHFYLFVIGRKHHLACT